MSGLKLQSLRVQNFRAFRDLKVDDIGRVNLVVGENNVGKTTLLEAIHLYASGGQFGIAEKILQDRKLKNFDRSRGIERSNYGVEIPAHRHLIHGHPSLESVSKDDEVLTDVPAIRIFSEPGNEDFTLRLELVPNRNMVDSSIEFGGKPGISSTVFGDKVVSIFLEACGKRERDVDRIWDKIELTPLEKYVLRALRIVEPELEEIRLKPFRSSASSAEGERTERIPVARLERSSEPEPLESLGTGMNRLFNLSLLFTEAKDGFFLVDEIENGLHYSALPKMWELIFEMANDLNAQVFATTHSFDCIQAFQKAADDHPEEGMLYSLRRSAKEKDKIVAVPYDEEELKSVARSHIEVR